MPFFSQILYPKRATSCSTRPEALPRPRAVQQNGGNVCRAVEIRPKVAKTERSVICDLSHSNGSGSGNSLHYMIFMQSSNRPRGLKTACRHAQVPQCLSVHLTKTVWLNGNIIAKQEAEITGMRMILAQARIADVLSCTVPSLKECLRPKCRNQSTLISNQKEHLRNLMFFFHEEMTDRRTVSRGRHKW